MVAASVRPSVRLRTVISTPPSPTGRKLNVKVVLVPASSSVITCRPNTSDRSSVAANSCP
jgi:hypothetical protein